MLKAKKKIDCSPLKMGKIIREMNELLSENLINTEFNLLKVAYTAQSFDSLESARAHFFIIRRSKDLRCLLRTKDVFTQHFLRSVHATMVQVMACTFPRLNLPPKIECELVRVYDMLKPVAMTQPSFLEITQGIQAANAMQVNARGIVHVNVLKYCVALPV